MQTRDVELGHFAAPEAGAPPGIVLIHDVWGLGDHSRDLARRLADAGFGALALDLYRREGEVKIGDPGAWMRALSDPQVIADVQAGIDFLAREAPTAGRPVGVTGVCMGGMYALLAACTCRGLAAAVPFYGMLSYEHGLLHAEGGLDRERKPRQPLDAVADLRCPLLAFFGAEDAFIPAADIAVLNERLGATAQPSDVVVYPGAGHAFLNDTRPEAYRPEVARDAWGRMLAFFREHLR
ncbi:MAG: dienelactone hydrolase family protein [Myxococcales bacterium]|nr:dienelactone hydrolase family protein [Myxococcales bacterium]